MRFFRPISHNGSTVCSPQSRRRGGVMWSLWSDSLCITIPLLRHMSRCNTYTHTHTHKPQIHPTPHTRIAHITSAFRRTVCRRPVVVVVVGRLFLHCPTGTPHLRVRLLPTSRGQSPPPPPHLGLDSTQDFTKRESPKAKKSVPDGSNKNANPPAPCKVRKQNKTTKLRVVVKVVRVGFCVCVRLSCCGKSLLFI